MSSVIGIHVAEKGNRDVNFGYAAIDEDARLVLEEWDGSRIYSYRATAVYLYCREAGKKAWEQSVYVNDPHIQMVVTDSRTVFICEKYDKGTQWYGGLTALVLQGVSSAAAAARRRGKAFVGMVRHEWLVHLGYKNKTGIMSNERVRLYFQQKDKSLWYMDILLDKNTDAGEVANDILHRACAYRMAMTDEKNEKENAFNAKNLTEGRIPPADDPKSQISYITFPTHYFASRTGQARPELGGAALTAEAAAEEIFAGNAAAAQMPAGPAVPAEDTAPASAVAGAMPRTEAAPAGDASPAPAAGQEAAAAPQAEETPAAVPAGEEAAPENLHAFCTSCGSKLPAGAKFCGMCGARVE